MHSESGQRPSPQEKALAINLSKTIYGSFAEIGAGQEVAACFFKVGGASGTVAKTISAYDMKFSDAIYGQCERYVCEDRLLQMLDHEYVLLPERLPGKISTTRFFAFADTIEALNFSRTNHGHGWLGLRFQLRPGGEPNELVIHARFHDPDPLQQQTAAGLLGVNMIYGAMFLSDPETILLSLLDGLGSRRVEIDMIRLTGPDFRQTDNRLLALQLVKHGMTKAAIFGPDGSVLQPSEVLYKRPVLVMRGRFRPPTWVNIDMFIQGLKLFRKDLRADSGKAVAICELTLSDLSLDGQLDERDFLNRADIICSLGQKVMISNYQEHWRLSRYLLHMNKGKRVGMIVGVHTVEKIFEPSAYSGQSVDMLDRISALFAPQVSLYVYPALSVTGDSLVTLEDTGNNMDERLRMLFHYISVGGQLVEITKPDRSRLHIISDRALEMIRASEPGWEELVPSRVAAKIKAGNLFGRSTGS